MPEYSSRDVMIAIEKRRYPSGSAGTPRQVALWFASNPDCRGAALRRALEKLQDVGSANDVEALAVYALASWRTPEDRDAILAVRRDIQERFDMVQQMHREDVAAIEEGLNLPTPAPAWIAVRRGHVVASGPDRESVIRQLDQVRATRGRDRYFALVVQPSAPIVYARR